MFQLIVTIISIALIVALALASIFYGGSAFTNSAAKTAEAALVNGGQQIAGASILYQNDNAGAYAKIADLVAGNGVTTYLQSSPSLPSGLTGSWQTTTKNDVAYVALDVVANLSTNTTVARVVKDTAAPTSVTSISSAELPSGETFGILYDTTNVYFAYSL
jgi:hypothetical protein